MREAIYIRLENTLQKAMTYSNSPEMHLFNFEGVQLVSDANGFIQRSNAVEGIELENFIAYVYNSCGDLLQELATDTIQIVRVFNDRITGLPQIEWKINTVGYDFGGQLVYLDILQGANYHIYSSPFYWTDEYKEYTSRWDYRNKPTDTMLSTQLKTFFIQPVDTEVKEIYSTVGNNRNVEVGGSHLEAELWRFGISDIYAFRTFMRMRMYNLVYLNYSKCVANEAIEYPLLKGIENFSNVDFIVSVDYENIFDPNYVAPIPPEPPVDIRAINIDSIIFEVKPNAVTLIVSFENYNIDVIEFMQVEMSIDGGITFFVIQNVYYINTNGVATIRIPQQLPNVQFPLPQMFSYLFRAVDVVGEVTSNQQGINQPIITITGVVLLAGSNPSFQIFFITNFDLEAGTLLYIQGAINSSPFVNLGSVSAVANTESYIIVNTFSNTNRFKITYPTYGIESNTYEL